ncbi:MAG: M23 family metallopeptidase [Bacteroidales bacterium]|nr:M23 family metallopeptidase [Candidatus Latescibacterota bacterium]
MRQFILILILGHVCLGGALLSDALGLTWPTDGSECVESPFGWREFNTSNYHAGWDLKIGATNSCRAVADGTIHLLPFIDQYPWGDYQYTIVIDHGDYMMGYHHMNARNTFTVGEFVAEGTWLGSNMENAHVHINFWDENGPVNGDDNTLHPGRILGEYGNNGLAVSSTSPPFCSMWVGGGGDVLKVGVCSVQKQMSPFFLIN